MKYFQYFKEIFYLLDNSKTRFMSLITFTLIISFFDVLGLSLIAPYISIVLEQSKNINLSLFDQYLDLSIYSKKNIILYFGIIILMIYVIKTFLSIAINKYLLNIAFRQGATIRTRLSKAYLNTSYEDFTKRNSSEYIYAIEGLTGQFSNTILPSLMKFISDVIVFIVVIIFLTFINWQIILLLFLILLLLILSYDIFFKNSLKLAGKKSNNYLSLLVKYINESMEGIKEIKIFNKENYFLNKITTNSKKYAKIAVFGQIIANSPKYILEMFLVFFIVLAVSFAISLEMDINSLLPTLGVFAFASLRLAPASTQIIANLSVLRTTRDTLNRLYKDALAVKDISNFKNIQNKDFEPIDVKKIELSNFTFRYKSTRNNIFENTDFIIKKGDIIGIHGQSGSGKTTLIDILLGLLELTDGEIIINDNIEIKTSQMRESIAYLPQKVFLLDDTIKNNIALGIQDESIDLNKINESVNKAQLSSLIDSLEFGIETNIGERGIRLSGGQRQRIALARAFYFEKKILILDESTNSLDKKTELDIINEVIKISKDRTIIIVSHDNDLFKFCNKLYKIQKKQLIKFK